MAKGMADNVNICQTREQNTIFHIFTNTTRNIEGFCLSKYIENYKICSTVCKIQAYVHHDEKFKRAQKAYNQTNSTRCN